MAKSDKISSTVEDTPHVEREPFMERHSHAYGRVCVYEPKGDPKDWHKLPWVVETEHSGKDNPGVRARVKAEYIYEAFARPTFITDKMKYSVPRLPTRNKT